MRASRVPPCGRSKRAKTVDVFVDSFARRHLKRHGPMMAATENTEADMQTGRRNPQTRQARSAVQDIREPNLALRVAIFLFLTTLTAAFLAAPYAGLR